MDSEFLTWLTSLPPDEQDKALAEILDAVAVIFGGRVDPFLGPRRRRPPPDSMN